MIKIFLVNKYYLYGLKLLFRLAVETSSLWLYMFRSVVRISVQGGSGHCVYVVLYIGASSILRSLKTVHLYRNMSQLRVLTIICN